MADSKPGRPLWRRVFDTVEQTAAPPLERFVQTPLFARGLAITTRLSAQTRRRVERDTRRMWHTVNLPAGSDVRRLREQVAQLDRQVRQLTAALEDARGEAVNGSERPARAGRDGAPDQARRRTQRPAGS